MLSIFNFLKKLLSWADETPRKRRASEAFVETENFTPKKLCNHHYYEMNKSPYIDLAEDDENVEIISEYISPNARNNMNNARSIVSHRNDISQSRIMSQYTSSASNCRSTQENNSFDYRRTLNRTSFGSTTCIRQPSTLHSAACLQEKQKYGQMIQNFLPKERHILRHEPEEQPVQEVEIIEVEKTPQTSHRSRRSSVIIESVFSPRWSIPSKQEQSKREVRQPIVTVKLDDDQSSIRSTKSVPSPQTAAVKMNTLRDKLASTAVMREDFLDRIQQKYKKNHEQRIKYVEELQMMTSVLARQNQMTREANLSEQLARSMRLCEPILDDREEEEEPSLPTLTQEMMQDIQTALSPRSPDEILAENFGLRILRRDIATLANLNWLNDEVINFYMNLLIERGKQDKFPNVHAMNTFFYPKLVQSGHASLKRWTRKVDIFAQDILVVPVHLGIHWCMSIIDFRDKSIRYYDSMGSDNVKCLIALRQYLEDESLDKKKKPYDTSDWHLECVKKIPQQMNGSDCGVFSCMFAEYICANKRITFTQDDMPYFRLKMVYEILESKLL